MDGLMDDDYDPLAPVHYGDDAVEDDASQGHDTGFTDGEKIVRVWVTDGRLSRVQVSPVWHHKVREKTLDQCFAAALASARIQIAPAEPEPQEPDLTGVDISGLPRFNRSPFVTYRLALQNFNQRWEEAVERAGATPVEPARPVSAETEGVTARLDENGHAVAVEFDDEWLEDVAVKDINYWVLETASRAHAAYEAAPVPRDELADLAREHEILMTGLMKMLTGKDRR